MSEKEGRAVMIRVENKGNGKVCELEGSMLDLATDITLALVQTVRCAAKAPKNKGKEKLILQKLISAMYKIACENLEVEP